MIQSYHNYRYRLSQRIITVKIRFNPSLNLINYSNKPNKYILFNNLIKFLYHILVTDQVLPTIKITWQMINATHNN